MIDDADAPAFESLAEMVAAMRETRHANLLRRIEELRDEILTLDDWARERYEVMQRGMIESERLAGTLH